MTNPYRAMAKKFDAPYESGITKLAVLRRDVWTCQMEVCCYGDSRIDPEVKWKGHGEVIPDEIGTIDHIVPLSESGTPGHVWSNVRAAHRLCNREKFSPSKTTSPTKPSDPPRDRSGSR